MLFFDDVYHMTRILPDTKEIKIKLRLPDGYKGLKLDVDF